MHLAKPIGSAIMVAALSLVANCAQAQLSGYYIGVDGLPTFVSGTYNGLANPNHGRLTLLFNHGDHFHGIGAYAYSGPAGSPITSDTNANNRLPEISSSQPPLKLTAGTGIYAGKLVSNPLVGNEYSHLEMRNTESLAGIDDVLYNSSEGRWNGLLSNPSGNARIHLELLSATAGLNVGTLTDPNALAVGGDVHLGDGDDLFSFTPVLWVDAGAATGTYSAEFRFVDENGLFGDSGRFFFDVQRAVPEPTSLALVGIGSTLAIGWRRRREGDTLAPRSQNRIARK